MNSVRRASYPALCAVIALLAGCRGGGGGGPAASVRIVEPADGATVAGRSVRVVLEAQGVPIVSAAEQRPGTAHHHLYLDTDLGAPGDTIPAGLTGIIHLGRAQTEFVYDSLAPGEHRIITLLADAWHVPLSPPAADTVRITVP